MAIGQFAVHLRRAREKAGLTQAALAARCGLTGSYISLMESGKKPAPSDRVVRRIATVLSLDPEETLQVAHLDRAPQELRRAVERLRREAAQERALRERTAEALFPLTLWNFLPEDAPPAPHAPPLPSVGATVVGAIEKLLGIARTSPDLATLRKETRRVLGGLPEKERRRVLDAVPAIAERAAAAPATRVVPAPGEGLPPEILPGDRLVVARGEYPAEGSIVLVEGPGGPSVRRWTPGLAGVAGVVVEVRRPLRGRP